MSADHLASTLILLFFIPVVISVLGLGIVVLIGDIKFYRKCGVSPWWLICPFMNFFMLGKAARRPAFGASAGATSVFIPALHLILKRMYGFQTSARSFPFALGENGLWLIQVLDYLNAPQKLILPAVIVILAGIVYDLSLFFIFWGLCRRFAVKKTWLILWMLSPSLTEAIWGYSKSIRLEN